MEYPNAVSVVELESGLWLIAAQGTDKPKLAWHASPSCAFLSAGKGSLWREVQFLDDWTRSRWHERIDTWLRNSMNDCLRARGDIRWRTACRAEMILRTLTVTPKG